MCKILKRKIINKYEKYYEFNFKGFVKVALQNLYNYKPLSYNYITYLLDFCCYRIMKGI